MGFIVELKRRNVFKVAVAYTVVAWLLIEISATTFPMLLLPEWTATFVTVLLMIGFPLALIFAWAFELTPEGLKREHEVDRLASITNVTGRKIDFAIIGLLALALTYFAYDKFVLDPSRDVELVSATHQQSAGQDVSAKPSSADKPGLQSIAVLPFLNRSANAENAEFFSDGIHDEILTNLSRIGSLKVISRTSVMTYRDTTKNIRQIGEELGVGTLLEGGVQRAGDSLRINVQLIDAATDEHIWANTYDRQLTAANIFAIQAEIAASIANALHAALSPEEQRKIKAIPTTNLEAYDQYLLAGQLYNRGNWDALDQALTKVNNAIELDTRFQEAYVLKSQIYESMISTASRDIGELAGDWQETIATVLKLNPQSGAAHAALAGYLRRTGEPGAAAEYELAQQLAPRNADILYGYARLHLDVSGPEKALELLLAAQEIDPLSVNVWYFLGITYVILGEIDKASDAYARIRDIDPSSSSGKGPAAGPYIISGDIPQSLYWLFQGLEADPQDLDLWNWIVRHYIDFGDFSTARRWLDSMPGDSKTFAFSLANEAILEVYAERLDLAVMKARRHLEEGMPSRWGSESTVVNVLLMDAVASGNPASALALIESALPALFLPDPEVSADNILQAIDTAHLMQLNSQPAAAESLLSAVLEAADIPYALAGGFNAWRVSAKAQALALLGRKQAAMDELRKQIDSGWRVLWHWQTGLNPNFASIAEEPEYQQLVSFLREDMARQLEEVSDMEAAGEIRSAPE